LQFEIIDNGHGMTPEQTQSVLTHKGKHYGIRNVKQRIALYYGLNDAINYESQLGKGTTVQITIPKKLKEKQNPE